MLWNSESAKTIAYAALQTRTSTILMFTLFYRTIMCKTPMLLKPFSVYEIDIFLFHNMVHSFNKTVGYNSRKYRHSSRGNKDKSPFKNYFIKLAIMIITIK